MKICSVMFINIYMQRNNSISDNNVYVDSSPSIEDNASVSSTPERKIHIHNKLGNWYSPLCNRWFSLLGVSTYSLKELYSKYNITFSY